MALEIKLKLVVIVPPKIGQPLLVDISVHVETNLKEIMKWTQYYVTLNCVCKIQLINGR